MMSSMKPIKDVALQNHSKYLRNILDPRTPPVSIPDDVMIPHIVTQEPTTYNLSAVAPEGQSTASGVILVWPNTPTEIVGAHYRRNAAGNLVFDQFLRTAQNIENSYDAGRLISRLMHIQSSTIPSGAFALNGTMNAVQFQGTPSEISSYEYSGILSTTKNPCDRKGNILIGEGVKLLSLPQGWGTPFQRLNDIAPSTLPQGSGNVRIGDSSGDLTYTSPKFKIPTTIWDTSEVVEVAVDGVHTIKCEAFGYFGSGIGEPNGPVTMSMRWDLIGLNGASFANKTVKMAVFNMGATSPATFNFSGFNTLFSSEDVTQVVFGVRATLSATKPTAAASGPDTNSFIYVQVTSAGAGFVGNLSPTQVVAYENVADGTTITIAGVSNYQLIPNPELQKNMELTYGEYNPIDATLSKVMLAKRNELELRTINDNNDWTKHTAKLDDITNYTSTNESSSFANILRGVKNVAVPVASMMAPQFSPLIGLAGNTFDAILPRSASGVIGNRSSSMVSRSSSGRPGNRSQMRRIVNLSSSHGTLQDVLNISNTPSYRGIRFANIKPRDSTALFPVVRYDTRTGQPSTEMKALIYAAVPVNSQIRSKIQIGYMPYYRFGGRKIYNALQNTHTQNKNSPIKLQEDYVLLPVYGITDGQIMTESYPTPVGGTSHQLSVIIAEMANRSGKVAGIIDHLFTGEINGWTINPVNDGSIKKGLANANGFTLYGNADGAEQIDLTMDTLSTIVRELTRNVERVTKVEDDGILNMSTSTFPQNTNPFLDGYEEDEDEDIPVYDTNPFNNPEIRREFEEEEEEPIVPDQESERNAKAIMMETRQQVMNEWNDVPLSYQERVDIVNDFLTKYPASLESIVFMVINNKAKSLDKIITANAATVRQQPRVRKGDPQQLAQKLRQQLIDISPEDLERAGNIVTPELIRSAPRLPNVRRLQQSLSNMWHNNTRLQKEISLDDFVDAFVDFGYVPTPVNAFHYARTGEDPGRTEQAQTPETKSINYKNWLQMLGENPPQELKDKVIELVQSIYNKNGGKGPNQEQNIALVREIKNLVLRKSGRTRPKESSPMTPSRQPTTSQQQPSSSERLKRFFRDSGSDDLI